MAPLWLSPPLLNSASPWATTEEDITALYECPHTGAVTTRTSLLSGFPHDPAHHQHTFINSSSLNTYGYSPHPLHYYLNITHSLVKDVTGPQRKPFIISITGTPAQVQLAVASITHFSADYKINIWAEINLSCPNIAGKPPPAYSSDGLTEYLTLLPEEPRIPVGIKTPPYTYQGQYDTLISVLEDFPTTLSFVTAVNTLGSCLDLSLDLTSDEDGWKPTLESEAGTGIGGLGGEMIHRLALGNVNTIRRRLDKAGLTDILVIGVGGVSDKASMERMLTVGAGAVGVATALGQEGIKVFKKIAGQQ
ncbi:hypothetical protein FPQ18DRAFT_132973 [Pyronema domesticum]|uniref:Dihydroorotate dehydrogenase (fumarate) n=1 Tax=Pyronema omphalodes (strain CBS 100304) TaxID=1076935 RepID=U4L784_PYROM|nr:hypothetical protein FPQ18DRAFT_132973 [Pyronema domesticum]CCX05890.1 Similar to Dihydroorotate dehydrogenase (fumarate); acc. no. Q4D3W2 [Pyronema omphalodes CBS 100304]